MSGQPVKVFLHQLALGIGCTRRQLEDNLSYDELLDWLDYSKLHPFGEERGDMRNALLCKMVDNLHFWLAGKASPHTVIDFMLFRERYKEKEKVVEPEAPKPERKGAKIDEKLLTNLFLVSALPNKEH